MIKEVSIDKLLDFNIKYNNIFTKYIAYYIDNKIVGYLVYENLYDRVEIDYIYVVNEYRNKKIGSFMMEYLINLCKKEKLYNITLEVSINNIYAIKLYEKYGFKTVTIRKGYYKGIDALLMEVKL